MITISGYKNIEKIHEGARTVVCRGQRERDQKAVILKILKSEYPTLEEVTQLRHEYEVARSLQVEGTVKAYGLEGHRNGLALILEDFGGKSLSQFIASQKNLELGEFLEVTIQIVEALGDLHKNKIIHKDIKPQNIIINSEIKKVKITDFSIASRLERENATVSNPSLIEGTLAYMSPEQTGRMNRSVDYRTDFYSLGVTFYEILCRALPFAATDPLELIHCHIAKQPAPPGQLNPEIPQAVSDIVMKLLAKTAEERYQSAQGLRADLEICLKQLSETGKIEPFPVGQHDLSAQFIIPQKLYGREAEVAALMATFDRLGAGAPAEEAGQASAGFPASAGRAEMMLVSGYSGIGKSALVQEIHKPVVRQRGYFTAGKFDQFKRNIPYSAVIQAFQDLLRQILTESEEKIAIWKKKLLDALGANGQVIVDVIPEVELIVGPQEAVPALGPAESQNRFNRVFKQFTHVFCQQEHPLVLFLDDLQWADSASLKLIELAVTDPESKYLLLIGAYRDNEVSPAHPLVLTLAEIEKTGAIVNKINLQPLDGSHVRALVADTLHDGTPRVVPLAELLFNKTQGNPFFLTQLLTSLYGEKLLSYDLGAGCWQWDIGQIQAVGITDYSVVELIARNIQKLPAQSQNVLKLAACIGNRFNLDVLAIVSENSQTATAADLWEALQAGLVLPLSDAYKIPLVFDGEMRGALILDGLRVGYKFLHDRVQQAAYSLIPEGEKKETHLKIGELLLENTKPEEMEDNIFDIVNQLNAGAELIAGQGESGGGVARNRRGKRGEQVRPLLLAQLNLRAGGKAKAAAAYEPAVRYLNVGLGLLPASGWQTQYDTALALHLEAAEAEYLNTNFERAAFLAEVVLQQATRVLDKVKVCELQIQFYMAQSQLLKALDTAFSALEMLGVGLSPPPQDGHWAVELPGAADLENLPEMTDLYKLAALGILTNALDPAYLAKPELVPLLVLTMVNLCIEHGYSARAAYVYSLYGMLLCAVMGEMDAGYRAGQLALRLLDKFNANSLKSKVYQLLNAFIRPWKEHVRGTLAPTLEGLQSGLSAGDLVFAGNSAIIYSYNLFFIGERLDTVGQQQAQYLDLVLSLKQDYAIYSIRIWRQLTLNILEVGGDKSRLSGEIFDEGQMLPAFQEANNYTLLFVGYLAKTILVYLFKDGAAAVASATLAAKYAQAVSGLIIVGEHCYYYSLALLALCPAAGASEQQQYLKQVEENQEKMQRWAENAPCNFQHKYELVEAEKARVLGQVVEAMEYYDRAIAGAKAQGYIQEEALANELAAEFYFGRGRGRVAESYLTEAYYGYIHWGATGKVKDLESRYPEFFARILKRETPDIQPVRTTTLTNSVASGALDVATVLKASQALAGEIVLDKLLDRLLKIVMESAGAEKSCLILERGGELRVEATGDVGADEVVLWPPTPVETSQHLPVSLINYVARTRENVVLNDAAREGRFTADSYIVKAQPKSILSAPIINQGQLTGILYLENNLTAGAFTPARLEVLKILSSQAAISLKNALLYANLEATTETLRQAKEQLEDYSRTLEVRVGERTLELKAKNGQLQQALRELQQTQAQLIQTEKMSSLGQLVAGVAHEINNPVNFIYGNLIPARNYLQNLLELIEIYERTYPKPAPEIQTKTEAIDLDFLKEDFPKILSSMRVGAERIRQIVLSLRNFSRLDEADMKEVDIHEGIDSTLLILQHRLKDKAGSPGIQVIKEFGDLPLVECYAGQLNQVFVNILTNAIDALEAQNRSAGVSPWGTDKNLAECGIAPSPRIRIRTELLKNSRVAIRIADNGPGMSEEVCRRLFDPFFTTKPVGSGTGLGLSISYQIVVEKHRGLLKCISVPGQGAEFIIEIPVASAKSAQAIRITP